MTAVREMIWSQIESQLMTAAIAQEIERMPSSNPSKFPALHLFDGGDESDLAEAGTDTWIMRVDIEGTVEGGTGSEAHASLNALDTSVIEIIFTEPLLGGLVTQIEAGSLKPMVAERASRRRLGFVRSILIHYATRHGSPQILY